MRIRTSHRLAVASGLAFAVAITTPAFASAQTAPATSAHPAAQPAAANEFPSSTSTVIGSIGFIDDYEVGYFWSAARGDSVEQTFSGPAAVRRAILKLDVTYNGLYGSDEDWALSINGTDVGSFTITQGQTGPLKEVFKFHAIRGGTYDVKLRETNEVPGGDGSIALRYAGDGWHSVALRKLK